MHDFEYTRLDGERECVHAAEIEDHDGVLHFYNDEGSLVGIVPEGEWIDCVRVSDDEEDECEDEDGECDVDEALDDVLEAVMILADLVVEAEASDEDGDR